ncbi:5,6-dimethylbenzimidazole synthase [Amycolatopsis pigmentata]|uniref:5,6-dimethylbenzimidazole synthase n=1 Tax=Amycolatopsis pigmentata TaxID=450801 RepID=A0ABW5FP94_9PSEU
MASGDRKMVPAAPGEHGTVPPVFEPRFQDTFEQLLRWRRDVRHFDPTPLDAGLVERILDAACLSPSVGNSQPWRFVSVEAPATRAAITANFERANADALAGYSGARAERYATLKLSGLRDAPTHLAVFCDESTEQGHGLGKATMPETLRYSAVLAVHTLWLAARSHGIGVGWVSILDPHAAARTLAVPEHWALVAYLCIGRPLSDSDTPELERLGWQDRTARCRQVLRR